MRCSYEWTYDKRGRLANCVERPELDPHRRGLELLTTRLSVCQRSVRVVVVGLSANNVRDGGERLEGRTGVRVRDNDGDEGRLRRRSRAWLGHLLSGSGRLCRRTSTRDPVVHKLRTPILDVLRRRDERRSRSIFCGLRNRQFLVAQRLSPELRIIDTERSAVPQSDLQ